MKVRNKPNISQTIAASKQQNARAPIGRSNIKTLIKSAASRNWFSQSYFKLFHMLLLIIFYIIQNVIILN